MSTESIDFIPVEQMHLLDELENLLEKQIEQIHQGDPAGRRIENMSMQADVLVGKIKQAGILELAQFINRRERIKKLYDNLHLAITAQKAETAKELNHIRKGKKTIVTYRNNI